MARDARELGQEAHSLAGAVREAREGAKALGYDRADGGVGEVLVAISHLESLIEGQMASNRRLEHTLERTGKLMEEALAQAGALCGTQAEEREAMQDAVMGGLMEAHSIATEHAIREITEAAEEAKKHLRALEDEAKARAERLRKVTLPDRLFYVCKWLLVLAGLVVCGHFVFHVVF